MIKANVTPFALMGLWIVKGSRIVTNSNLMKKKQEQFSDRKRNYTSRTVLYMLPVCVLAILQQSVVMIYNENTQANRTLLKH